jgi:effector-binding domain-containing protein
MAVPISGRINIDSDDIEVKNLPQGKAISLIYTGPYADVGIAYTKAMEYAHTHGYKVLPGGAREIYLNDPNQVADDQLMTELQIQIKENGEDDK